MRFALFARLALLCVLVPSLAASCRRASDGPTEGSEREAPAGEADPFATHEAVDTVARWIPTTAVAWLRADLAALRAAGALTPVLGEPDGLDPLADALRSADEVLWVLPDGTFARPLLVVRGPGVGAALYEAAQNGHPAFAGRPQAATGRNGAPVWRDPASGKAVHTPHPDVVISGVWDRVLEFATRPLPPVRPLAPSFFAPLEGDVQLSPMAAAVLARRVGAESLDAPLRSLRQAHAAVRIGPEWDVRAGLTTQDGVEFATIEALAAVILVELVAHLPADHALRVAVEGARFERGERELRFHATLPAEAVLEELGRLDRAPLPPGLPTEWLAPPPAPAP